MTLRNHRFIDEDLHYSNVDLDKSTTPRNHTSYKQLSPPTYEQLSPHRMIDEVLHYSNVDLDTCSTEFSLISPHPMDVSEVMNNVPKNVKEQFGSLCFAKFNGQFLPACLIGP